MAIYSVIETAKVNGLDAYGYLKFIIDQLPLTDSEEDIVVLLPWNIKKEQLIAWDKYN